MLAVIVDASVAYLQTNPAKSSRMLTTHAKELGQRHRVPVLDGLWPGKRFLPEFPGPRHSHTPRRAPVQSSRPVHRPIQAPAKEVGSCSILPSHGLSEGSLSLDERLQRELMQIGQDLSFVSLSCVGGAMHDRAVAPSR